MAWYTLHSCLVAAGIVTALKSVWGMNSIQLMKGGVLFYLKKL